MKYINLETSHLKRGEHERNLGKCIFLTEAILLHVTSDDAETLNFWLQCPELHTFRLYWLSSENLENKV